MLLTQSQIFLIHNKMKKETPKKPVRRAGMFANPIQEGAPSQTSQIANPSNPNFRPEAPELKARRDVKRNQG